MGRAIAHEAEICVESTAKTTPDIDRSPTFQSPIPAALLAAIVSMVLIDNVTAFLGRNEVIIPAFDDNELSTPQFRAKFGDAK